MGLDMYLKKNTYVGAGFEHRNVKGVLSLTEGVNNSPIPIRLNRVSEIIEEVAYWRKANHIHKWFVDNVQEGKDDCRDYKELINACKSVISNKEKASEILPTQSGFFFGSTDYDEYFFQDCEETVKMIEPLLEENGSFYYTSSW